MKQPELGKKISELRRIKGLTQEELVDKCNISVRTLQRIETGEVAPRAYTIKTIFAAFDYELNIIEEDDNTHIRSISEWIKKYVLLDTNFIECSAFFIRRLNLAWILGISYFLIEFFNAASEGIQDAFDIHYNMRVPDNTNTPQYQNCETQYSTVFDITNLKLYFSTKSNTKIREINFRDFEDNCSTKAKLLDIQTPSEGIVNKSFVNYSMQENSKCIFKFYEKEEKKMAKEEMEFLSFYPEFFECDK